MNSNDVNRLIRSIVRPVLKAQGFEVATARSVWRHRADTIDVVNFQSFNRYNADVLGCSTFSFAVNLAVYLNAIPAEHPISVRAGRVCPHRIRQPHPQATPASESVATEGARHLGNRRVGPELGGNRPSGHD